MEEQDNCGAKVAMKHVIVEIPPSSVLIVMRGKVPWREVHLIYEDSLITRMKKYAMKARRMYKRKRWFAGRNACRRIMQDINAHRSNPLHAVPNVLFGIELFKEKSEYYDNTLVLEV